MYQLKSNQRIIDEVYISNYNICKYMLSWQWVSSLKTLETCPIKGTITFFFLTFRFLDIMILFHLKLINQSLAMSLTFVFPLHFQSCVNQVELDSTASSDIVVTETISEVMVRRVSSVIFVQGFLQAFSMSGRKHKTIV